MPGLDWSYVTELAAEPQSAGRARDFVCLHLAAHQLSHLAEAVRSVVSELATNAVVHAGTPFSVTLSSEDGCVRLAVRDGATSTPVRSTPGELETCGRGLVLVEMLSRQWGVSPDREGGKSVWATFSATSLSIA